MQVASELLHTYLPMTPPFVAMVSAYLLICGLTYWCTRERGFLVAFLAGSLFLLPYFMY